jgi:hypothetical protein
MTGFRVALGGAQSGLRKADPRLRARHQRVRQGHRRRHAAGGLRRHARRDEQLAPLGPVYQAGTLSGNPVATACGLATLKEIAAGLLRRAGRTTRALGRRPEAAAREAGVPLSATAKAACSASSSADELPQNYGAVMATDKERFNRFFHACWIAACTWRRRCTRPASSAPRTATPTSPPRWPQHAKRCAAESLARAAGCAGPARRAGRVHRPRSSPSRALSRIAAHAHPHSRHLRHLHGRLGRAGARGRPPVTGCDANVYPPMSDQLRALGID